MEESQSFDYAIKEQFIQGGWQFMGIVLLCLIPGLAVAIERIITLNLATTNTKKLLEDIDNALSSKGGVNEAKEICKSTRGPVASIFVQGLMRASEGIDMVEKSIISYGSVEMGKLEKGMVWISLFISLAPMLGVWLLSRNGLHDNKNVEKNNNEEEYSIESNTKLQHAIFLLMFGVPLICTICPFS